MPISFSFFLSLFLCTMSFVQVSQFVLSRFRFVSFHFISFGACAFLVCSILYSDISAHRLAQCKHFIITIFWLLGQSENCTCRRLQKMPSELSTAKGSFWQRQKQSHSNGAVIGFREYEFGCVCVCVYRIVRDVPYTMVHQLVRYILAFMRMLTVAAVRHAFSCSLIPFSCSVGCWYAFAQFLLLVGFLTRHRNGVDDSLSLWNVFQHSWWNTNTFERWYDEPVKKSNVIEPTSRPLLFTQNQSLYDQNTHNFYNRNFVKRFNCV